MMNMLWKSLSMYVERIGILFIEILLIPCKLQKGLSGAQADDTKGLKGVILDWITPPGQSLTPPIARNVKVDRGFNHERTGSLLCPAGLDWTDPE
jgi:Family of unknown function (DUF6698)